MKIFYVYIMASKRNGTLYVGVTTDLALRVAEHKNGTFGGFTSKYGVSQLVYFEDAGDAAAAFAREKSLKRWRRDWKLQLIESKNPRWEDLGAEVMMTLGPAFPPGRNPG